jgi:bla regulator protein blaR1
MNLTTQMMQSEWMKALGWTFVHSLWQIALIGILLFVVLRLIPGRRAHTRYAISTLALWMVVIMALSTFIIMLPDSRGFTEVTGKVILVATTDTVSLTERISAWLELHMPMMLTIWVGGVAILMFRLAISLAWVRHIRTTSIPEVEIQQVLNQIIQRLRLKINPTASRSDVISSPITIGHLKPLILFPVGIINQLTPNEVEAILTHELAHIVRRDYLSNLVQSVIETIFYYHPVTWWISRMVRSERENRADDLAVTWCGDHLGYAKALMAVQEMQVHQAPGLALGFAGRKGAMLARIQRILNLPYKNHNQMEKTVLLSLCSICFLAFTLTSHTSKADTTDTTSFTPFRIAAFEEKVDSIPAKGTYRIHKKTDDQDIHVEVEDGNIRELTINGKEIEASEFEEYDEVIDKLFGEVETPPSMEGFGFSMPPMPPMPAMPRMPMMPEIAPFMEEFNFEMPPMPPMPEIELERLFNDNQFKWFGDGSNMSIWNGEGLENFRIYMDSLPEGENRKMIIIVNGDSIIHEFPNMDAARMEMETYMLDKNLKKEHEQQWREQWREQADQWREQGDQWRQQQEEMREQMRRQSDERRAEQDLLRKELRGQQGWNDDHQREMERELRMMEPVEPFMFEYKTPRLSLSDQLVRDGLVAEGDEVSVLLTPDKLRINGQKMPDAIHQKYLRMYEKQQGVELSGNSRVEFTTKSKQRM